MNKDKAREFLHRLNEMEKLRKTLEGEFGLRFFPGDRGESPYLQATMSPFDIAYLTQTVGGEWQLWEDVPGAVVAVKCIPLRKIDLKRMGRC